MKREKKVTIEKRGGGASKGFGKVGREEGKEGK